MKVFGNPATKAKIRRYIVWGIEDGIVCAAFFGRHHTGWVGVPRDFRGAGGGMMFTPEELAAMRAADEEIDRTFEMTEDDLQLSRAIDQQARQERSKRAAPKPRTEEQRARARAYQKKRYWEKHEEVLAYRRRYYAERREDRAAETAAYRRRKLAEAKANGPTYFSLWLKQNGITQKEAAERLCVSLNCVTCWAAGIFRPKVDKIRAVWPEYGGET